MPTLAKLQIEPRPDRGPDVEHHVRVPVAWLERGATIECELPRRLPCATCSGGGCDVCARSGAFVLYDKGAEPTRVVVHLTPSQPGPRAVRLHDIGAPAADGTKGCLILHIGLGEAGPGVRRLDALSAPSTPIWMWVLLAAVVGLLCAGAVC